jgi:hypothetical protein
MSRLNRDRRSSLSQVEQNSRFTQTLAQQAQKIIRTAVVPPAAIEAPSSVTRFESEDARMTGLTRSLNRRLLALNLRGRSLKQAPLA